MSLLHSLSVSRVTQLTLRTFHAGGIAGNMAANASIVAKNNARLEFEELRTVDTVDETTGEAVKRGSRSFGRGSLY